MVDVIGDPDGPNLDRKVRRPENRRRGPEALRPIGEQLTKDAEFRQIDSVITPECPEDRSIHLRSGVNKRGAWKYYKPIGKGDAIRWIDFRDCTNGERAALMRYERTGKVARRHGPGGIELFYRE